MTANKPLTGVILIDCAKANAGQGLQTAAYQCGYGDDLTGFLAALQSAGEDMGVDIQELKDLQAEQERL